MTHSGYSFNEILLEAFKRWKIESCQYRCLSSKTTKCDIISQYSESAGSRLWGEGPLPAQAEVEFY